MNKELLEILLQFYSEKPRSLKAGYLCNTLNTLKASIMCSNISCYNCLAGRTVGTTFAHIHTKLDQIQITLKVITDEP